MISGAKNHGISLEGFLMYGVPQYSKKGQGGPVVGPGTGTSDSIKRDVPAGTFIMPADSTARLGLDPEMLQQYKAGQATKSAELPRLGARKDVPVNLSNGEYELPPEQVHAVGVQALNQMKDATHAPVQAGGVDVEAFKAFKQKKENLPRLGLDPKMMQQYKARQGGQQFFADGGLVDDPDKLPRLGARRPKPGIVDGLAGGAKALAGAALLPQAAVVDGVRAGAARLTGGDPATLEGGASKYRDMAADYATKGWDQAAGAADQIQSAGREALGVKPLAKPPTQPVETPSAVGGVPGYNGMPRPQPSELPRLGVPSWNKTGVGAGAQGGEIATRTGADGVPEFSNDSTTVAGADDLPRLGVGRIGNGVGTFSQAEAGDSQLALGRFERAGEEREKMIQASRRGQIGEGGGRVTVVADSSREPTFAEIQRAKLDGRVAQTEALQSQTRQGGAESNQRMTTAQLEQQKLQQDLATGQFSVQDRQRIAELQARMVDPGLSEAERTSAREAYTALSTQAKDRYQSQDVILGRDESGKDIRGTQLIDVTTGRPVAGGAVQPQRRAAVSMAEVEQTAKARGLSSDEVINMLKGAGITVNG
ncbi:hypothetical protein [Pseudomonas anguilliseptica]|uniref:hypothetical protein n=1 Tax=Pseudomonas anguilliseptica TaxID=53406 RepID=UPI0022B03227|nr:hypothetical protein [Pseudomonas anguilliseptica]MCZ4321467.1 hypothetical protein [Pseudomonas anguilliseptica]